MIDALILRETRPLPLGPKPGPAAEVRAARRQKGRNRALAKLRRVLQSALQVPPTKIDAGMMETWLSQAVDVKKGGHKKLVSERIGGIARAGEEEGFWTAEFSAQFIPTPTQSCPTPENATSLTDQCRSIKRAIDERLLDLGRFGPRELESLFALTAIFHGGLLNSSHVAQLAPALRNAVFIHTTRGWIDFPLDEQPVNPHAAVFRWFLDPRSIGVLRQLKQIGHPDNRSASIHTVLEAVNRMVAQPFDDIDTVLDLARAGYDHLPRFLIEVASGHLASQSLPPVVFQRITQGRRIEISRENFSHRDLQVHCRVSMDKKDQLRAYRSALKILSEKSRAADESRSAQRKRVSEDLSSLMHREISHGPATSTLLIGWALKLATEGSYGTGKRLDISTTIHQYLSLVGSSLIKILGQTDLLPLEPEETQALYEAVLVGKYSCKTREKAFGRLQDFHEFLVRNKDAPRIDWACVDPVLGKDQTFVVDANLVTEQEFRRALDLLKRRFQSEKLLLRALQAIMIIAFRFGLRQREILHLRLSDCHMQGTPNVMVEKSRFWITKTVNAPRPVEPLGLQEDERDILCQFYQDTLERNGGDESQHILLLTDGSAPLKHLDEGMVRDCLLDALREAAKDPNIVLRHLRHGFANKNLAAAFGYCQLFEQSDLIQPFELEFSANEQVLAGPWKVAGDMGHATPAITLKHYLHTCDWLISRHVWSEARGLEPRLTAALFAVPPGTLRSWRSRNKRQDSTHHFALGTLRAMTAKHNDPIPQANRVLGAPSVTNLKSTGWSPKLLRPHLHLQKLALVLCKINKGQSLGKTAREFELPVSFLVQLSKSRETIEEIMTTRGTQRHGFKRLTSNNLASMSDTGQLVDAAFEQTRKALGLDSTSLLDLAHIERRLVGRFEVDLIIRRGLALYMHRARPRDSTLMFRRIDEASEYAHFLLEIGVSNEALQVLVSGCDFFVDKAIRQLEHLRTKFSVTKNHMNKIEVGVLASARPTLRTAIIENQQFTVALKKVFFLAAILKSAAGAFNIHGEMK